jgi:hypothetical protein
MTEYLSCSLNRTCNRSHGEMGLGSIMRTLLLVVIVVRFCMMMLLSGEVVEPHFSIQHHRSMIRTFIYES